MLPSKWHVLCLCDTSAFPDVLAPLRQVAVVHEGPATPEALMTGLPMADAYLASLHVRCDEQCLRRATRLRYIATPSTGLDHIDLRTAQEIGAEVLSLRNDRVFLDSITATAELTWGLLLSVIRRIPSASAAAQRGEWSRDSFRGSQLSGKTLGVLGYGRLGRMVASYGLAFRMRVIAYDVQQLDPDPGVEMVSFERLLAESDVLSVHIHLTEETRGLLGAAEFSRMRDGAILLNTSRGAIVVERDLVAAIDSGKLAGAGLDVIDGEWDCNLECHPLIRFSRQCPRLVITPHIGGITLESQRAAYARIIAKLVERLSEGR